MVASCGGSSGSGSGGSSSNSGGNNNNNNPTGPNVDSISVNSGPLGKYANGIFTSVTVCAPGTTSSCTTISGVLIDTGSYGLRVLSPALNGLSLPQQKDATGNPIGECAQFSDGITWGAVKTADIQIAGESASSVPIEVINDAGLPTVPSKCSSAGKPMQTQNDLLANGIIGIGPFAQDCPTCSVPTQNPGFYYACPTSSTCAVTTEPISQQVVNPVSLFATDNNGTILELPSIPASGTPSVNGFLVFGIGTQSNNGVGSAKIFTVDQTGNFTTQFNGKSYGVMGPKGSASFIDSGSNGIFFLDSATTGLPTSTCQQGITGFYCPSSTQSFSATQQGANGNTGVVNFSIADANTLFSSTSPNFAFNDLGGPNPNTFDWGLPFFFGRNVITAIDGQSTPSGMGPYWAY